MPAAMIPESSSEETDSDEIPWLSSIPKENMAATHQDSRHLANYL
jgi:hypothetical protein